jgi:hypothetical protein
MTRAITFEDIKPNRDLRWWKSEEEDVHENVFSAFRHIRDNDTHRLEQNRHHKRLYGGPESRVDDVWRGAERERVSLNVIKSATDAVVAKIGKQRPHPRPLTRGGSPDLQRRAKLLDRFIAAQFDISDVYQEMTRAFLDACVFGTGVLLTYATEDELCVERVYPSELFVDRHDGMYKKPRSIIRKRWVARDALIEDYPEAEDVIRDAHSDDQSYSDEDDLWYDPEADQVLVLEAWRTGPKGKGGRHVICVDSGVLVDETWDYSFLPFEIIRWSDDLEGFWGRGVAEELNGIQREINKILQKIQAAFHLLAVPRVFVDAASKFHKAHFNNRIGAIVPYVGKPPVVTTPSTIHPEMFAHLDRLYNRAYEIVGVSQLSATQKNPLGADASGIALQTWHDMESERFSLQAEAFSKASVGIAKKFISYAREIGGDFAAPSERDRNTVDWVSWKDVDMDEDAYILRVFPTSSLPQDPAGRLAAVTQMLNAQLLSLEEGKALLNFPDLDAHHALDRAASELIDSMIEDMLDEGEYHRPEPFMDLQLALKKSQFWYQKAKRMGVTEDRLVLLRRFMKQTKRLLEQAQVEQQKLAMQAAGMNTPTDGAAPPAPGPNGQPPTAVTPEDGPVSA